MRMESLPKRTDRCVDDDLDAVAPSSLSLSETRFRLRVPLVISTVWSTVEEERLVVDFPPLVEEEEEAVEEEEEEEEVWVSR